ncbi:TPA: hypothetical protein ACJIKU_001921 [Citrobacter freundii]
MFFLLAVGLSFIGISSLITYFVLIGIVFPVIVSMHLHRLNEAGTALTLTENTQWMVYIHGFPAQEQRSVLKNPCFFSQARLRQFFIYGFSGKLCLQIACIAILAHDYANGGNTVAALFVLACLLIFAGISTRALYCVATHQWQCETLTTNTGSVWYQGFFPGKEGRETLFSRLV